LRLLYLLRHAKASGGDPGLEDRDRPLNSRGRRAARFVAEHLRAEGVSPELVLCSASLRTRQTLAAILPALDGEVEARIEDALYSAGAEELLERLRTVPDSTSSVLVIGHNPGLHELALSLAGTGRDLEPLCEDFPSGALATLAVPEPGWAELAEGDAELTGYAVPRELG
jgi:phosphohistidine phosphatase